MLLPIFLIVFAVAAAAVMAFGTNADLAQYHNGLEVILLTRRLEWPLVILTLACCIGLLLLVITNKRRAWWLIALGPVTALFVYRFSLNSDNFFSVAENPQMLSLSADQITIVRDDDWVVGVELDDEAYALPYQSLYSTPVVIVSNREKRLMVLWSPFANVARAWSIDREIKSRELDIVSMPANALLVYNTRIGQFINGLTGLTPKGQRPDGLRAELPTVKTTWKRWRVAHPESKVMVQSGRVARNPPAAPVLPVYPLPPGQADPPTNMRIALIPTTQPIAVAQDAISTKPLNVMAGKTPVLIFRDAGGQARAFDRRFDEDLMPRFEINTDSRRKGAAFVDSDTNTGWSALGVAVDGDKDHKGKKLRPLEIQEDLYWGVMKYWYPDLRLEK